MKTAAGLAVLLSATLGCQARAAPDDPLQPFTAHYVAQWKGINVAASEIELKAGSGPGEYVYRWTTAARGVFRVVYSDPVIQTSWLTVQGGHVRPGRYRGEQGGTSVEVEFNWLTHRAVGTAEGKPIDLPLETGAQDLNSIQVELMMDLRSGDEPKTFQILDKDELKDFDYLWQGPARLHTELGELDTVVVASQRKGNDRVLRLWFAPSLGYIPVRAERTRAGNLEFSMHITSVKH